jgi:hypothetical protein
MLRYKNSLLERILLEKGKPFFFVPLSGQIDWDGCGRRW